VFGSILRRIGISLPAIGRSCFYKLIKNWSNLSFTTLILKLVILEEELIGRKELEEPHLLDDKLDNRDFKSLCKEVHSQRKLLENRFKKLYENANEITKFPALKCERHRVLAQGDEIGPYMITIAEPSDRGQITLEQLTDRFLHLIKFHNQLVPGILARMAGYSGVLGLNTTGLDK